MAAGRAGAASPRLWRRPFVTLWAGQAVSALGSQVSDLALPLSAILLLRASPLQMGILVAAEYLPAVLVGLFAGVAVDRLPRRLVMLVADAGRAALLASIPLAALLRALRIEQLYLVAFVAGLLGVFFDIAATSFLPALVPGDQLVAANSAVQLGESVASLAGPGLAGLLIQALSAPLAVAADAASFVVSAVSLGFLCRVREPHLARAPGDARHGVWRELGEGLGVVVRSPVLRAMVGCSTLGSMALRLQETVFLLYATRELRLAPFVLGLLLAGAGSAAVAGSLLAPRSAARFGQGRAILWGTTLVGAGMALVPLASGPAALAIAALAAAELGIGLGTPIYAVNQLSLRQVITPARLLGRVNATRRLLVFGAAPLGALAGGLLASALGLRAALVAGALVMALAVVWTALSPLGRDRALVSLGADGVEMWPSC